MYKFITLFLFALFAISTIAQTQKETKIASGSDYENALKILNSIEAQQPNNYNVKFLIGSSYLKSENYQKSKIWLNKCVNYTDNLKLDEGIIPAPVSTYFLLGKSHYYSYEFDTAQIMFEKYINFAKTDANKIEELDVFMQATLNAKTILSKPIGVTKNKLSNNINSLGNEFKPLLNSDETIIIFSREDGIYISKKENKKWGAANKINELLVGEKVVAASLSVDGNQIYINSFNGKSWNIYQSNFNGKNWIKPTKLSSSINSNSDDKAASISPDGNTMYFSSNRNDGYGGFDIFYSSRLPDGSWGEAINIGKDINTQFDDYSPFIFHDNNTLYFSSTGHNSMGEKDIFISNKLEGGRYSKPQNIGYPINTIHDDELGYISVDGARIYYSTKSDKKSKDIHIINLKSKSDNKLVVIESYIQDSGKKSNIKDIVVEILDKSTRKSLGIYKPNSVTGKLTLILPIANEYIIKAKTKKYTLQNTVFEIPKNVTYYQIKKPIRLKSIGVIK